MIIEQTEVQMCENCNEHPRQWQNGLCNACYEAEKQARMQALLAEIARVQAEQPIAVKKSSKRK